MRGAGVGNNGISPPRSIGLANRTGAFATVTGTDLGGGLEFEVSYEPASVRFEVVPAP